MEENHKNGNSEPLILFRKDVVIDLCISASGNYIFSKASLIFTDRIQKIQLDLKIWHWFTTVKQCITVNSETSLAKLAKLVFHQMV